MDQIIAGFKKAPANFKSAGKDDVGDKKKRKFSSFDQQKSTKAPVSSISVPVPRFDPNEPDTFKYEIRNDVERVQNGDLKDANSQETSKNRFYDVSENLKEIIGGKKQEKVNESFSLLKLLGREDVDEDADGDAKTEEAKEKKKSDAKVVIGKNLFKEKFDLEINDLRLDAYQFFDAEKIKRLKADDKERRKRMDESFGQLNRTTKKVVKEKERIRGKIDARKAGHLMKKKGKIGTGDKRRQLNNKKRINNNNQKKTPKQTMSGPKTPTNKK